MKRIILLMSILLAVSLVSATRASGYAISPLVSINTLMPPLNLSVYDLGGVVQLSWSPPSIGVPDYYNVYRSETPDIPGSFSVIEETPNAYYEDTGFYYGGYYVTAVHILGESRASNIVYVGRMQPVNVSLSLDLNTNSAVLSWERVREADNYLLYYTDNPGDSFPAEWNGPITILDNQFIDPLAGKRFYKVMARLGDRISPTIPVFKTPGLDRRQRD